MQFSIVIPHWNGLRFLKTCFDALEAQTIRDFEVILVDNASADTSVEFTTNTYPWVKVIHLATNTGFDGAVNAGIKASAAPLIILLNNDTEVEPGWLAALAQADKSYPKAGIFASKLLDFSDRSIIDSCGDALCWNGRSYCIGELQKDDGSFDKQVTVFGAKAAAAMYRREMFDSIGLFDETFFAYLEDIDIDFRAQLSGFTAVFIPEARVYHIGSATAGKGSAFSFRLMVRNHIWLILKNYPLRRLITSAPALLYAEMRLCAAGIRQGYTQAYFLGLIQSLPKLPEMLKKRWHIQRNRTVSIQYLDSIIDKHFAYKPLLEALHNAPKPQPSHGK